MVTRSEGLLYEDGQGYSKLDAQAHRDRLDGYAVVSGLGVTVDSGLTLSVASGEATVGQTSGSVDTVTNAGTTVTLNSADSTLPRKDVVYIDTNGNIQATAGTPQTAEPSGNTRDNTYVPEPPFPGTEGAILAEVWVGAGVTTLQSADVRDRRAPADVVGDRGVFGTVSTDVLKTEPTGALVELSSNQSLTGGSAEYVAWDSAVRDPDNLLNTSNNSIDVPSGFSYAKYNVSLLFDGSIDIDLLQSHLNGSIFVGGFDVRDQSLTGVTASSAWASVSSGDSLKTRVQTAQNVDIRNVQATTFEAWLI